MILLDTCVLIWWTTDQNPTATSQVQALRQVERFKSGGFVASAISVLEVARKIERGELDFGGTAEEWFAAIRSIPILKFLDITPEIALHSVTQLRGFEHRDPADRIIISTALTYSVPVLTTDRKMIDFKGVPTVVLS